MSKEKSKEVRAYVAFTIPVDPANVRTLADLDLSYALSNTLVGWNPTRELVAGLADSWKISSEKQITFVLSKKAKWSDGKSILAEEVVASLRRAKKAHGDSLKTLFDLVEKIESSGSDKIIFNLNVNAEKSGVIRKLTEPMYGVVALNKEGSLDLTKSSGPFILKSSTDNELSLIKNSQWIFSQEGLAESIILRRPKANIKTLALDDPWANVVTSSSLMPEELSQKYKKAKFTVWNRSLDRLFFLSLGPNFSNSEGRATLKFLSQNIQRSDVVKNLAGYTLSEQFFPQGYVLYNPEFQRNSTKIVLSEPLKKRSLVILGANSWMSEILQSNLQQAIKAATGIAPVFKIVAVNEFEKARAAGYYDILAGALPVNDPNIEGAMGFFFGLTPSIIPDAGDGQGKFQDRIAAARHLEDQAARNGEYRKIFSFATQEGSVLPLFHYSTTVIAKEGIDLSQIPTTDETIAFSKVRFK